MRACPAGRGHAAARQQGAGVWRAEAGQQHAPRLLVAVLAAAARRLPSLLSTALPRCTPTPSSLPYSCPLPARSHSEASQAGGSRPSADGHPACNAPSPPPPACTPPGSPPRPSLPAAGRHAAHNAPHLTPLPPRPKNQVLLRGLPRQRRPGRRAAGHLQLLEQPVSAAAWCRSGSACAWWRRTGSWRRCGRGGRAGGPSIDGAALPPTLRTAATRRGTARGASRGWA